MRVRILIAVLIVGLSLAGTLWLSRPAADVPSATETAERPPGDAVLGTAIAVEDREAGATPQTFAEPHPLSEVMCPAQMAWVAGEFCPRVAGTDAGACSTNPRRRGFCIDRHEYPNQSGVRPVSLATFAEAEHYCAAEGKRLCRDREWTAACRGVDDEAECNLGDGRYRISVERFRTGAEIATSFAEVDGRRSSGPTRCGNRHGVFDMLGNVREWVRSEHPGGYEAALKGGHYNQVSIGCDRSIQTRRPFVRYPTTGLRCCADALVDLPGSL